MTALSTNLTYGIGSLRFNPQTTSPEEIKGLAKVLLAHPSIGEFLRGPIKYYWRGKNDVRLEYGFEITSEEVVAEKFYQDVHTLVQRTIHIVGTWHHSHWTGVELSGALTITPQVLMIFKYGASLTATGIIPGEEGYAYRHATIMTPEGKNMKVHLFKQNIIALCDAISKGLRESATTGRVAIVDLPFGM